MPDTNAPVSRLYVYRVTEDEEAGWYSLYSGWIGWMRPEAVYSDVTPEQDAKYQAETACDEILDEQALDRLRFCDWHSVWRNVQRAATAAGWDGSIGYGPRLCTVPLRGLVYGWTDRNLLAWYVSDKPMPWAGPPAHVFHREVAR